MLFTSEQVSCGHPDKICDQIADAVVTDCLRHDSNSRVAVECMIKENIIILAGEITSIHEPDTDALAHDVLRLIGVPHEKEYTTTAFITRQSPDIALGVDKGGAGDQGIVYGYATNETPELMPLPFMLATRALQELRRMDSPLLLPDAKAQVTYDYDQMKINTFLISTQHKSRANNREIGMLAYEAMRCAAAAYSQSDIFNALINPTGRFVTGGSFADTGVTGRKIIADSYGGACRHGGGAFSGKDPTKVDRSGAYMARKIACDMVSNGFAQKCEVQIGYAIGVREPVSVAIDCFGTNTEDERDLLQLIRFDYDLTPAGIIRALDLKTVDYNMTAAYGHFGKPCLPWEQ